MNLIRIRRMLEQIERERNETIHTKVGRERNREGQERDEAPPPQAVPRPAREAA